jgi:membrane-bound serine protease (ClpP class)
MLGNYNRRNGMRSLFLILAALLLSTTFAAESPNPDGAARKVVQLSIDDAIGPATEDYLKRELERASFAQVELVILRMDTPGGLDSAMRGIIKAIINSPVPVATFVAPSGARAASAGTYILYASHIAAMSPGTNLGAATPVSIGGLPGGGGDGGGLKKGDKSQQPLSDPMKHKVVNDAVAYIRGLAQMRGRNVEWAEKAVREAASLPATEALKLKVIDLIAGDTADLLRKVDGRKVVVQGHPRQLHTAGLVVQQREPDWRSRLLSVITNPNIAYILMLVGFYGLILEFAHPGSVVPGTIGAIALMLALFAFQLLPINYAGFGLILLGVGLMVGEAYQPSFGMLGIGGAAAFVFGSIILIDSGAPGFGIDLSVILTFALTSVLLFVFVIGLAIKSRRRPVVSGLEQMIGGEGVVIADFDGRGTIAIHSERWSAVSASPLKKGARVKVTGLDGLVLQVVPVGPTTEEQP